MRWLSSRSTFLRCVWRPGGALDRPTSQVGLGLFNVPFFTSEFCTSGSFAVSAGGRRNAEIAWRAAPRGAAANVSLRDQPDSCARRQRRQAREYAGPCTRRQQALRDAAVRTQPATSSRKSPLRSEWYVHGRVRSLYRWIPRPSSSEPVRSATWRCRTWFCPLRCRADAREQRPVCDSGGGQGGQIVV